jgi:transposase
VWSPGAYLVIDWAQAAPGLFLFCAVLAFSRWRFVAFATDQKASTTLALIAEAFGAIGGVPARVLADRVACLKGGVVANVVIPTAEYVRLAGHYGFAPDFCHADDPQSKGVVENLCGYAQRDLAVARSQSSGADGDMAAELAGPLALIDFPSHVERTARTTPRHATSAAMMAPIWIWVGSPDQPRRDPSAASVDPNGVDSLSDLSRDDDPGSAASED